MMPSVYAGILKGEALKPNFSFFGVIGVLFSGVYTVYRKKKIVPLNGGFLRGNHHTGYAAHRKAFCK